MSKNSAQRINYDGVVILVEGRDDYLLVKKLVTGNQEPIDMKGYTNLPNRLEDIKNRTKQFQDGITHLLIIVDADDNFSTRKQEVLSKLSAVGISLSSAYQLGTIEDVNNIKVGVYILPDNDNNGSLESLLLQSIKHSNILECAENMIQCRKINEPAFDRITINKHDKIKYRLHMNALVVDYDFHYDKTVSSEIDYSHECFNSLKQFVNP
ncbi:MAG: hypothetical protein K2X04_10030 [Burkholderiales bacterium]|nr:hypothetical protein [Burkholderiales bacterium]